MGNYTNLGETTNLLADRLYSSGPIFKNCHMIDLHMYDSSLFANSLIIEDSEYTTIVDTGTSNSIGSFINYIQFNEININNVIIIPTHHHFDHIGGIEPLIEYLLNRKSNVTVLSSKLIKNHLINPSNYRERATKVFKEMVGEINPIKEKYIQVISENEIIELGNEWSVQLINTPGHSDDHLSPFFKNQKNYSLCYLGEAFGINLKKDLKPIPASSAPGFKSEKYIESIKKILHFHPDMCIYTHFGGINGYNNIKSAGNNAIKSYFEFKSLIKKLYNQNSNTSFIAEKVFSKYANEITTQAINIDLAKNLAYIIVYGILLDENLKKNKNV
ncbi:MAG: MBL fold metallo-hydrolase [archaeon]|nr:MBL fold metallo-hydrolase [archaeon]